MASRVIGGNLANNKKKLGFIHIPKCGGCSVACYLHMFAQWDLVDFDKKTYAAEPYLKYTNYKLFTTIRHPVDWMLSGYKMYKQRRNYNLTFDQHVDAVTHTTNTLGVDWAWHCQILPNDHLKNFDVKIFKLEEISKLPEWLSQFFSNANEFVVPVTNATDIEHIEISKSTMNKIKKYTGKYADRYEYEL